MKKKVLKAFSLLLAVSMLIITATVASGAPGDYVDSFTTADGQVELDGTNPGTVTVGIVCDEAVSLYGIEGTWYTGDVSGLLTLSAISSDVLDLTSGLSMVDIESGWLMWLDLDGMAAETPTVVGAGKKLLTATYTVAADAPEGEYTVSFSGLVFAGADAEPDETETVFTASIAVTHKPQNVGLKGDVNLDGVVDMLDFVALARHVGEIEYITDSVALTNADVNEDEAIDMLDFVKVAQYVGEIITDWDN